MGVWIQGCTLCTVVHSARVRGRVRALPWGACNGWLTGERQLYSDSYITPYETIDGGVDSGLYPVYCGTSS
jgi:hypothetical protein